MLFILICYRATLCAGICNFAVQNYENNLRYANLFANLGDLIGEKPDDTILC